MKKLLLALTLGLALGGCAQLTAIETGLSLATKSITNPVTTKELYEVESTINVGLALLQNYKSACARGAADVNCRDNVAKIQVYTREIPPYLMQLRRFVKANDQINATLIYNNLVTLYSNAKQTATNLGVNMGVN